MICSLAALPLFSLTTAEVGLVPPCERRGWKICIAGICFAFVFEIVHSVLSGDIHLPTDAETFAFQATMPGLDEELSFRGIEMALLARAFPTPRFGLPVWLIPLIITTVIFTAGHMIIFEHGTLSVMWKDPLIEVLPMGLLLGLLRISTGSLIAPLLSHNAANLGNHLTSWWCAN